MKNGMVDCIVTAPAGVMVENARVASGEAVRLPLGRAIRLIEQDLVRPVAPEMDIRAIYPLMNDGHMVQTGETCRLKPLRALRLIANGKADYVGLSASPSPVSVSKPAPAFWTAPTTLHQDDDAPVEGDVVS